MARKKGKNRTGNPYRSVEKSSSFGRKILIGRSENPDRSVEKSWTKNPVRKILFGKSCTKARTRNRAGEIPTECVRKILIAPANLWKVYSCNFPASRTLVASPRTHLISACEVGLCGCFVKNYQQLNIQYAGDSSIEMLLPGAGCQLLRVLQFEMTPADSATLLGTSSKRHSREVRKLRPQPKNCEGATIGTAATMSHASVGTVRL